MEQEGLALIELEDVRTTVGALRGELHGAVTSAELAREANQALRAKMEEAQEPRQKLLQQHLPM